MGQSETDRYHFPKGSDVARDMARALEMCRDNGGDISSSGTTPERLRRIAAMMDRGEL